MKQYLIKFQSKIYIQQKPIILLKFTIRQKVKTICKILKYPAIILTLFAIQLIFFQILQKPMSIEQNKGDDKDACIFDNNEDIVIFDRDDVSQEKFSSEIQLFTAQKQNDIKKQIIDKIEQEIKSSQQNFFKVKIVRTQKPKKMMRSENLTLATKNKQNIQKILKEGYLEKKVNTNIFFKWNKRYFAISSQKLYSFEDQNKEKIVGCINFKRLPATIIDKPGLEFQIDFFSQSENLTLKAQNLKQKKNWMICINSVIDIHALQNKMLFKTISKPIYLQKDSLTEKQFIQMSETGDILLFLTDHTGGKLQRFFTQSDYDHVAMVIKFKKTQAMVFEANQISGVALYDWKYYIHYFDLYEKVAIRKLNYIKKQELHAKILSFVRKNIGKHYDLNALKLFKQQSNFDWNQLNKEEDRGYFCSELIAKVFKSVGLLQTKKASSKYWPVDFSEKSQQVNLKYGAKLQKQQIIVLNKHLKKNL